MINKTGDELDYLDITEIHGRLVHGELSSAEFTQRCLDRIAKIDPELNAVVAIDHTALEQAARSDQRGADLGWLDGIPVLVNDNIDTAHLSGDTVSAPNRDADVVTRLRAAGAVIIGKTNLSEWPHVSSPVRSQTHNPYRIGHSPWGPSAGSAVAVAAGLAPLALGTETDGSIVGPAGVCGVVGVKPELGLLSPRGVAGVSSAIDTVGPFASRLGDAALCLAALAQRPDLANPTAARAGCRVGLWRPTNLRRDVAALLVSVVEALGDAGVDVVDIELSVPDELVAREQARAVLGDVLRDNGIQAIVAPTNEPAWPIDHQRGDGDRLSTSTLPALAGYANVALPAGLVDGLPCGVSVFGPATVATLLGIAVLIERSLGPRPWPDLV